MPIKKPTTYDVHPAVSKVQKWVDDLSQKTGKTLSDWIQFIEKEGHTDIQKCKSWLTQEHGFGTQFAHWLSEKALKKGSSFAESGEGYLRDADDFVEKMYSGKKAALRPMYDSLVKYGRSLGKDVRVSPCKTIVPLYRKHVFAQIKPTTQTRIDVGLCLKHFKGKLPQYVISTGGAKKDDRITHRIEIKEMSDINDSVKKWMKTAYDLAE